MINEYREYGNKLNPSELVILIHGYGSNCDDLVTIAPELSIHLKDALFISINAPTQFEGDPHGDGRQWFSLLNRDEDIMYNNSNEQFKLIENFSQLLCNKYQVPSNKLGFLGFSQGGMMAIHTAYRMKEKIAGVISYSGMLIKPSALKNDIINKPPAMLIHGNQDVVVPQECLQIALKTLDNAGVETDSLLVNNLGHGIDKTGIETGAIFLKKIFS